MARKFAKQPALQSCVRHDHGLRAQRMDGRVASRTSSEFFAKRSVRLARCTIKPLAFGIIAA